jgi:phosphoribosylaminoimidazolecarboxamide formyltransferase / IMP cyclohydrolase
MRIERAILSVSDKTGIVELAKALVARDVEILSTGGTAKHLADAGIPVTSIASWSGAPEILGGRVKTLHPRIHAAILARRDHPDDLAALDEHDIHPFDLVCVNLYPFTQVVSRHGVKEEDAVEMIDIGGPSMLRAAAKNFAHVAPVCRPERYGSILAELRESGQIALETRRALASEAFSVTAAYEAAIARWFADRDAFPDLLIPGFEKVTDLVYGENPHQRAAYYSESGVRRHLLSRVGQLHGRELSFNNLADLSAARMLMLELTVPACVIVKHGNPCGVAVAGTIEEAYDNALTADPMSAYGGVVVLNRPVGPELGAKIAEQFVEVLLAPDYDQKGLDALQQKPNTRILVDHERRRFDPGERDFRRVLGGMLVQDRDWGVEDREGMEVVVGEPSEADWGDLLFAWRVCKHVTSNAIVIVKDLQTIGVGAGQMSRVDAVKIAVEKARELGHDPTGAALASDAFFPFPDGPRVGLDAGVKSIIQPGGSKRDQDVLDAVEKAGAAMVFTHRRHFRH